MKKVKCENCGNIFWSILLNKVYIENKSYLMCKKCEKLITEFKEKNSIK